MTTVNFSPVHGRLWIAGQWQNPNGRVFESRSPARPSDLIGVFPQTTTDDTNLPSIGAEVHLPFGGVKKSGNGHPSAASLIETVTHKTAWTVNHTEEVKMAQGLTTDFDGGK